MQGEVEVVQDEVEVVQEEVCRMSANGCPTMCIHTSICTMRTGL